MFLTIRFYMDTGRFVPKKIFELQKMFSFIFLLFTALPIALAVWGFSKFQAFKVNKRIRSAVDLEGIKKRLMNCQSFEELENARKEIEADLRQKINEDKGLSESQKQRLIEKLDSAKDLAAVMRN